MSHARETRSPGAAPGIGSGRGTRGSSFSGYAWRSGGPAGAVRGLMGGQGLLEVARLFGLGVLGVLPAVAWIVNNADRR